jgi:hypothetical protein
VRSPQPSSPSLSSSSVDSQETSVLMYGTPV